MAKAFGSLGDFFPDTDIRCRVRGCGNVWQISGEDALRNVARGRGARPERMCDECYGRFLELEDREVPCTKPGCERTWTWNRFQQLEHQLAGRSLDKPPRGFCKECREELNQVGDLDVPCRMKGCPHTWTWYRRERLMSGDEKPPRRLCHECFQVLKTLEDREIPCRIKTCQGNWHWNRFQQLEHQLAGKPLDKPPKRMCADCYKLFHDLQDREEPCRVKECARTWTYRAYDQLEHLCEHGPEAPPPERMCPECYLFFSQAQDQELRCRNRGCEKTWTYTRSAQLHAWLRGNERPPARMCEDCTKKLEEIGPAEVACMVPGCGRTWTCEPLDQLRDQLQGRIAPIPRRCKGCDEFLASHEATSLACVSCGATIAWSAYEQLLHALGTFAKPSHCPDCNKQIMSLQRPAPAEAPEHHLVIRIPSAGRWHEDDLVRPWPRHMTPAAVAKAERADLRIVAIGDDLTYSADEHGEAWPELLEQRLEQRLGKSVSVINAGIPGCTTHQALLRLARDVKPFQPHVVLFSFVLADARLDGREGGDGFRRRFPEERTFADMDRFWREIKTLAQTAIYWTPNPAFPEQAADESGPPPPRWVRAQTEAMDRMLLQARHCCLEHEVGMADFHLRFSVNGSHSAQKWMRDWCRHNLAGATNIAAWFADFLVNGALAPDV